MTSHPTNVGRTPIHIGFGFEIEDVLVGKRHLREIAAGGVHDALGLCRGARGVEQIQQLLGIHRLCWAISRYRFHKVVVPVIATFHHRDVGIGALHNNNVGYRRARTHGIVDIGLQ
ncbi:unannotated protein [freshwater metagenome]|uniref:Unannotated protein n=1 Tax=freshwater metagenome TaxID=449393 RepID=A0A6J6ANK1_9ZZZZ